MSLIEIVVGLAILAIALGGIYGLISQSVRSFGVSEDFLEVQQNARVALGRLAEEAKWAGSVAASSAACPWPTCVELSVSADNPLKNPPAAYTVRFQWNNALRRLERVEGGNAVPLADYVAGVTFRYLDRDGAETAQAGNVVRVDAGITVQRGVTTARVINSDVFLRNAVPTPGAAAPPPPGVRPPRPLSTRAPGAPPPPPPPPPSPTVTAVRTRTPTPVPTTPRPATPTRTRTPTPVPTTPRPATPTPVRTATRTPAPTVTPLPR